MQGTVKLSALCRNREERKLIAPTVHLPTAQHVIRYFYPARSQTILQTPADRKPKDNDFTLQKKTEAKPQADVLRRETNRLKDEVFVSINLSLPQDTHRNILLKASLDTGAEKHTANEVLQSNVQAEPKTWFLITIGYNPHCQRWLTDQAPRYHYYTLFLQRKNHSSILLCHRHPKAQPSQASRLPLT